VRRLLSDLCALTNMTGGSACIESGTVVDPLSLITEIEADAFDVLRIAFTVSAALSGGSRIALRSPGRRPRP
jgi:hypothetical protein